MDSWRLPDRLWAMMEPLLPFPPAQPRGGRPPVPARRAMEAIWFVMRTGCPWRALDATTPGSSATAERRFREWKRAGVFERLHRASLDAAHASGAIDWAFLAVDGHHVKAPLSRTQKGGRRGSTGASRAQSGRPSSTGRGSSSHSP
jgi:transposase